GTTTTGTPGSPQIYTIVGGLLTAAVTVSAPTGVELSSDNGSTWHTSLTLPESGGTLANTIEARLSGSAGVGSISGSISNTSPGVTEKDVAVSGAVTAATLATTTTVTSSPNPSVFGQSVTFTATVSAASPGSGTPTGTVTFEDGGTTL